MGWSVLSMVHHSKGLAPMIKILLGLISGLYLIHALVGD